MGKTTPPKYLSSAIADVGKKFGKLTVIEVTNQRSKDRKIIVKCLCECGTEILVRLSTLRIGNQTSCGCSIKETAPSNGRKAVAIMIKRGKWSKDPKMGTAKVVYNKTYHDADLSFEDFLVLSQQNCFYCQAPPSNGFNAYSYRNEHRYSAERIRDGYFSYNGLDRIDNTKGHSKDNVVPCCYYCNRAKLDRTMKEFFDWMDAIRKCHPVQPHF